MTYEKNGKCYSIPNAEIEKLQAKLKISKAEAADVWLADHDYEENEEQALLNAKAGKVAKDKVTTEKSKAPRKPRTVKISDEKQMLFKYILGGLLNDFEKVNVLTENKLISVEIDGKIFKIDIVEQRKAKN